MTSQELGYMFYYNMPVKCFNGNEMVGSIPHSQKTLPRKTTGVHSTRGGAHWTTDRSSAGKPRRAHPTTLYAKCAHNEKIARSAAHRVLHAN